MSKSPIGSKEALLQALVDEITIPPSMAEEARDRFSSIAEWMDRDASILARFSPLLHPQGSFLLGTVIRPVGDHDEYDVDMVCTLRKAQMSAFSQAELKTLVGHEVHGYARAHGMQEPTEGRRCWTIDYAKAARFHCDVLPSLPEPLGSGALAMGPGLLSSQSGLGTSTVIGITDRKHPSYTARTLDWFRGNPKGYELWFKGRQRPILQQRLDMLRMQGRSVQATVEDLPLQRVRTPLQDAIKLLKRHRDVMFAGDEHKPISIIIATLAARAYGGQATISETLEAVLPNMDFFIEDRWGIAWVENPAYPGENFADKWAAVPIKGQNFRKWLVQAKKDFGEYVLMSDVRSLPQGLRARMSETTVAKVLPRLGLTAPAIAIAAADIVKAEAQHVAEKGHDTKPWLP